MAMRINDLARELEVKSREILESLPGLGIDGKRSHSSSLEDDQVLKVKRYFERENAGRGASRKSSARREEEEEPEATPAKAAEPEPTQIGRAHV